ncbi:plasmid pRiA4b ORF-3 family protein [Meridianimarinicoccus aquatilis]|nr:plasmid pRiA4b ORF-3 family protein [Fluviibacterium aquatile]
MSIIELKITLDYIEAVVTRTLQVPADIRLDVLKLAKRWKPKDTRLS